MNSTINCSKKKYSSFNLFCRSFFFSITMAITCIFESFLCLLAAPLPLRMRYAVTKLWIDFVLKLARVLCHIDYQVKGLENIKKIKNGIIMSKHQSTWETFFLASRFSNAAIIVKRELTWIPFFGWGMALLAPISINRSDSKSAMQQITQQGKQYLGAGRWIIMFPEGTRIAPGYVGKYRVGGARLAVESGYPIIPVAHNAGLYWPRRGFIKKPGTVQVAFGPPIDPAGLTPEQVLVKVKNWIEGAIQEMKEKQKS